MKAWKAAGLGLAVGACVLGFAGWQASTQQSAQATVADLPTLSQSPRLALPAGATIATPQPITLDAALARKAVHDGVLRVALPDGTTYPVRIARQYTDSLGRWNVVGHADTTLGPQSMVLTFGAKAVFGMLPMPDGRTLAIATNRNGVTIAPAGNMKPNVPGATNLSDLRIPPRATRSLAAAPVRAAAARAQSAQRERLAPPTPPTAIVAQPAALADDLSPVRIDVLALYSNELVTRLGSQDSAETAVANQFALANDAHAASGTRITVQATRVMQIGDAPTTNSQTLQFLTNGEWGIDTEAMRDADAADLVAFVRPYYEGDPACGVAWLQSAGLGRTMDADAHYGYVVTSFDPTCSPYVLAHELGHAMGSMHDRQSSTDPVTGRLRYGAFPYSFGYRTQHFATVMAYTNGMPRIGHFSNPDSTACGAPCGVAERMDNVRSLNRMASAIAMFREPAGAAHVGEPETLEPVAGRTTFLWVPIRAFIPAGGVGEFDFEVIGGTATRDVDYTLDTSFPVGMDFTQRDAAWIPITVLGDDDIEGDETIALRVTSRDGLAPVANSEVIATIVDDDPRAVVSGRLWFPPGIAPPTTAVPLIANGVDGREDTQTDFAANPPDFAYSLSVPRGAPLRIFSPAATPTWALAPTTLYEVEGSTELPLLYRAIHTISGQLKVAPGLALPANPIGVVLREFSRGEVRTQRVLTLAPPDYRYSVPFAAGSTLEFSASPAPDYAPYFAWLQNVASRDQTFDIVMASVPSLYLRGPERVREGQRAAFTIHTYTAVFTDVGFRYRTIDGTAKAGTHYVATSGTGTIVGGAGWADLAVQTLANASGGGPKYFDVVIDQVVGAQPTSAMARIWIGDDDLRTGGGFRPGTE